MAEQGKLQGSEPDDRPSGRIAVRWLPVKTLKPDKRNARVHSAAQIARLANSIKAFGFNVPVLLDENGGVLAGHGRLKAARRLGLGEVPTITLAHLSQTQRRAFMIADNRLAELASWDEHRLGVEFVALESLDLDFALEATGFTIKEIDLRIETGRAPGRRMAEPNAIQPLTPPPFRDRKPVETPLPSPPEQAAKQSGCAVARAGEKWSLGPHWLCCGDTADAAAGRAVDAAVRRWQELTGESARLHPTGESFDAVARARRQPKGESATRALG